MTDQVRIYCDTSELPSGIPELLRSRGIPTRVCVLRKTRRLEHIEDGCPMPRLSRILAPRADYLFVFQGDLILAAVERKTRGGILSDFHSREASGERHLSSQLTALCRLPDPTLIVEGRLPWPIRHREAELSALISSIREQGLPVIENPGKRDTTRLLEGQWWTLMALLDHPGPACSMVI